MITSVHLQSHKNVPFKKVIRFSFLNKHIKMKVIATQKLEDNFVKYHIKEFASVLLSIHCKHTETKQKFFSFQSPDLKIPTQEN